MRKKRLLLIILCMLCVLCILTWEYLSDYSTTLKANWGFSLPVQARYKELYAKDSGPSFHGDGIRYHVYSYKHEDYIDSMFAWSDKQGNTVYNKTYSQEISQWLDGIDAPDKWRPDYDNGNCRYWYKSQHDNSQIIVIWNQTQNRLYIAEHFI